MPRAEVQERLDPVDAYELDPKTLDPDMHYRWTHPRNHQRRVGQGYEIVLRGTHKVRFLNEEGRTQAAGGDRLWRGESYLMCCKKSVYNERRKRHLQYTNNLLSQERVFTEKARRRGVRTLTDDEGEEE